MKFRHSQNKGEKIVPPMAPMIDVVFQLLIFFMLTLKIVSAEGDFNINMPIGAPGANTTPDVVIPPLKVRLTANENGQLTNVLFNGQSLGSDPARAFASLNNKVLGVIGTPGSPLTKDVEVEIEADYELHYRHVISAVGAVTGRMQTTADGDQKLIRYIEKIKFAPPNKGGA